MQKRPPTVVGGLFAILSIHYPEDFECVKKNLSHVNILLINVW